jgi:hypothetical protein
VGPSAILEGVKSSRISLGKSRAYRLCDSIMALLGLYTCSSIACLHALNLEKKLSMAMIKKL